MYRAELSGVQQFLALIISEVAAQFDGVCEDGRAGKLSINKNFSRDSGQGNTVIGSVDP